MKTQFPNTLKMSDDSKLALGNTIYEFEKVGILDRLLDNEGRVKSDTIESLLHKTNNKQAPPDLDSM